MSSELIFFIIGVVVANAIVLGVLALVPRDERGYDADAGDGRDASLSATGEPAGKYAPRGTGRRPAAISRPDGDPAAQPHNVLRILWWVTIAIVLIGVGVSDAFGDTQRLVYAVGAAGVVTVIVLHELLPVDRRRPASYWAETVVALGLVVTLLTLTGHADSPFFFALILITVAVALARGGRAAYLVAALAAIAYLGVLVADPRSNGFATADLLRFALNIGSIWLLAFLATIFSGRERRIRSAMLQLSVTDPLTGLYNRAQIYLQLDQEVRRTRRSQRGFCLLMIDLDGLKEVNDSFGHHRGDEVLAGLGLVIQRSIRMVDSAYRYGGDEFVVLLPETDIVGAFVVAEKIRSGAEDLAVARVEGAETSVSIGLVSHPEDGSTVDELMIAADRAMYAAKRLGKNQISGYPRPRRTLPPPAPVPSAAPVSVGPTPVGPGHAVPEAAVVAAPPASVPDQPSPPRRIEPDRADVPIVARNGVVEQRPEQAHETDDFDPAEARRRIAALSYDPDHQIRRAMDAFLSSPPPRERREPNEQA